MAASLPQETISILEIFSPYGPWWILLVLLLIIAATIALLLTPTIKRNLEKRQDISERREERKNQEAKERAERDGQLIQLLQDTNRVIERNSQAFRSMTNEMNKMAEKDDAVIASVKDVKEMACSVESAVNELRLDIARSKGNVS